MPFLHSLLELVRKNQIQTSFSPMCYLAGKNFQNYHQKLIGFQQRTSIKDGFFSRPHRQQRHSQTQEDRVMNIKEILPKIFTAPAAAAAAAEAAVAF